MQTGSHGVCTQLLWGMHRRPTFSCIFLFFALFHMFFLFVLEIFFNAQKVDFNQQTVCKAPIHWLKYTTNYFFCLAKFRFKIKNIFYYNLPKCRRFTLKHIRRKISHEFLDLAKHFLKSGFYSHQSTKSNLVVNIK